MGEDCCSLLRCARLKLLRAQHKFDRHCQAIPVYGECMLLVMI
jgi:hypothetical protein